MKTIKVKIFDKYPYSFICECGKVYKNANHKWCKKHIKKCEEYKESEWHSAKTVYVS